MADLPELNTDVDYMNSYAEEGSRPNKGTPKTAKQSNVSEEGMNFVSDDETLNYIAQQNKRYQGLPSLDEGLTQRDFYPTNQPIAQGQFSGPLYSGTTYSEGAPEIPFELIQAKMRARQKQAEQLQKADQLQQKFYEVKDKVYNDQILNQQLGDYGQMWGDYKSKYKETGVPVTQWDDKFMNEPEVKRKNFLWRNATENFNETFDEYTKVLADAMNPQSKGGEYSSWRSPQTIKDANAFFNHTTYGTLTPEIMMKYNPHAIQSAESIDKTVDEYWKDFKGEQLANQVIAAAGSELASKGTKNTSANDVYEYIKTSGFNEKFLTNAALKEYTAKYNDLARSFDSNIDPKTGEVTGGAEAHLPSFKDDFLPRFLSRAENAESRELKEVGTGRGSDVEWARWAQEQKEKNLLPVRPQDTYDVNGTRVQTEWSLMDKKVNVEGNDLGLPSGNYRVVKVFQVPGENGKSSAKAEVVPVKYESHTDANGKIITKEELQYGQQQEVNYSNVQSSVESSGTVLYNWNQSGFDPAATRANQGQNQPTGNTGASGVSWKKPTQ